MNQEYKELLLKDLSARLPYRVKVQIPVMNDEITLTCGDISAYFFNPDNKLYLKPYLRPMSSMTEEEVDEFTQFDIYAEGEYIMPNHEAIDWLNKNMFDYRGLIRMDLALEAPEGMYNLDNK